METKKPAIGIDLDDTAWLFMHGMSAFHNRQYGTNHEVEDFPSFNLSETWKCTKAEAIRRIDEFVHSPHHGQIVAAPGAVRTLTILATRYKLLAITAREPKKREATLALVTLLFGELFSEVHLLGHQASKGEFCIDRKTSFVVDDGLHNAHSIGERGIPVYLMDRPWNQCAILPPNTTRVFHWYDILHQGL